jgi:histidinol-phosphatase (PHP family)
LPEENVITPLPFEGVSDYHCHCDFSTDAVGTIDEYCRAAIRRNLAEICFTSHYDTNFAVDYSDNFICINGEKRRTCPDNLAFYVEAVRKASEDFYPLGLSVKLGLEFGWHENCEESAVTVKERFGFDYFLCGMHQLDNLCFWGHGDQKGCFDIYDLDTFMEKYFRQVVAAARSGLFDTIAHVDYYKRKAFDYYGERVAVAHRPYLAGLFEALTASDTGLEINTAALRHGRNEYYPKMEIVNAARRAGVQVVRLGSDAHRPDQVGYDFEGAVALVPSAISGCED